jgi:ribosomal protein S18 acetylase RimI-like enzyme
MTTPLIRRANEADAELLNALAARTFWDTFARHNRPEDMDAYMSEAFTVAKLAGEIADPRATFFVLEIEGVMAGYAKLYAGEVPACVTGARPIEIARLYVSEEFLGKGVGAALMDACLDEARRSGCDTVFLGVWEHNERAKAFYRKCGFEVVGSHPFILGEDHQTDLWMTRSL